MKNGRMRVLLLDNQTSGAIASQALAIAVYRILVEPTGSALFGWLPKAVVALPIILLAIGAPLWFSMRAPGAPRPPALPPIVPLEESTPLRRLYRRFAWIPLAPILVADYMLLVGVRPSVLAAPLAPLVAAVLLLGPVAYMYWMGDRYR